MEQEYFTPRELAKRLWVDDSTVRCWIRTGALEAETIRESRRNRHRIRKATIETLETPSPPGFAETPVICTFFFISKVVGKGKPGKLSPPLFLFFYVVAEAKIFVFYLL